MDINNIIKKKFPGTYNAYSKKGYKKVDCCFKITYGFCGKKGYNKAYCYTKKNIKKSKTLKDKV
jgi:hypothetical protein